MKKIAKLILSLSLTVVAAGGIIGVGVVLNSKSAANGVDSFKGYVSDIVFDTKEQTVRNYVEKEFSSETKSTEFINFEKISNLSRDDIDRMGALSLTDKEIIDGEEVNIKFSRGGQILNAKACIFNTGFGYIYYVPPVETGGLIPNTYFNYIFNKENYLNSTYDCTVNMRTISEEATNDSIYHQQIYFADKKAYFDQDLPGLTNDFYFEEKDGRIISYLKHPNKKDGKFYSLSEINNSLSPGLYYKVYLLKGNEQVDIAGLTKMDEIISFMFSMNLDSSFFVKTDRGFSMTDDRYKDVCKNLIGSASTNKEIDEAWDTYQVHFRGDYYVNEDRLSAYQIVLTMVNNDTIYALEIKSEFSNFGTTEIEMPYEKEGA